MAWKKVVIYNIVLDALKFGANYKRTYMLPKDNLLNLLRINQLFHGLSEDQLASLLPLMQEVTFNEGEFIIKEGDAPDKFYIIETGQVNIIKKSPDGKHSFNIRSFGPGDVIGEIGILSVKHRAASVKATTPVVAFSFSIEEFNSKENLVVRHIVGQNISLVEVERLGFAYDITIDSMRNELKRFKQVAFYQGALLFVIVCITYYIYLGSFF